MSNLTKMKGQTKLIFDKAFNERNLKVRKSRDKFNNSLIELEIIIEDIEKINNNERLGVKEKWRHDEKSIGKI